MRVHARTHACTHKHTRTHVLAGALACTRARKHTSLSAIYPINRLIAHIRNHRRYCAQIYMIYTHVIYTA